MPDTTFIAHIFFLLKDFVSDFTTEEVNSCSLDTKIKVWVCFSVGLFGSLQPIVLVLQATAALLGSTHSVHVAMIEPL